MLYYTLYFLIDLLDLYKLVGSFVNVALFHWFTDSKLQLPSNIVKHNQAQALLLANT